jgi:TatD DNase family protein
MMVETDAPYLTPHPHRGKRNEPSYVALVCEKLAALYGISAEQMAQESTALAQQFFGLQRTESVSVVEKARQSVVRQP